MRILVADDSVEFCETIASMIQQEGWEAVIATVPTKVLEILQQEGERINALLLDLEFHHPEINGMDILQKIRLTHPTLPVLILTGVGTIQDAVEATKLGAIDFLSKSELSFSAIREHLYNIGEKSKIEDQQLLKQMEKLGLVGSSQQIRKIFHQIVQVARTDLNVLITGETGTGKGVFARAIHQLSPRQKHQFVEIDLPNIRPELFQSELFGHEKESFTGATKGKRGLFEEAQGGTIFLDEIGELSLDQQAALLIPIEEKRIRRLGGLRWISLDVRFISATDKNIEEAIRHREFRPQLYYRLQEYHIHIPPLRERREDIRPIAEYYIAQLNNRYKTAILFEPDALCYLENYDWPGNVRQLRNLIERLIRLAPKDRISRQIVAEEILKLYPTAKENQVVDIYAAQEQVKKESLMNALSQTKGNITKTAALLGVSRETVYQYLRRYNIDVEQYRLRNETP